MHREIVTLFGHWLRIYSNDARQISDADPLSWSDDLYCSAQAWANRCVFEHSKGSVSWIRTQVDAVIVTDDKRTARIMVKTLVPATVVDMNHLRPWKIGGMSVWV